MKKYRVGIVLFLLFLIITVNVNLKIQPNGDAKLFFSNIEALSQPENSLCQGLINMVPNHYLMAVASTVSTTCNTKGILTIGGTNFSGNYERGRTYQVVLETKNCNGEAAGACCDQNSVGVRIVSAT